MYRLSYFTEEDNEKVIAFMKKNSFVVITGLGEYPVATHVPVEIRQREDGLSFTGHIMRNSDHHKAFLQNDKVLVIFNGPHCHISASWYSQTNVASTWNYMSVHARGRIRFGDEAETLSIVKAITEKYEGPESPSAFDKLPPEYVDRLVKGILSFTVQVERLENVFKLSQNHDIETRKGIIAHLQNGNEDEREIAAELEQRIHLPKAMKKPI